MPPSVAVEAVTITDVAPVTACQVTFSVDLSDEAVRILDGEGAEVVCWQKKEWKKDAAIVPSICGALKTVYEQGLEALQATLVARGRE